MGGVRYTLKTAEKLVISFNALKESASTITIFSEYVYLESITRSKLLGCTE